MTEIQRLAKIMVLKDMRKEYELRAKYNGGVDYDCYRALDMAIEELEQEPCTDAIRRQEMRLIDANALKKDLTRFYDNEVTAKQLIDEQPTIRQDPCGDAISRQAVLEKIHEAPYINDCSNIGMLLEAWINSIPSVKPQYTDAEIQKMQDLEFAEIQKAYEIGKAENIEVLDEIRSEIVHLHDWAFSRGEILRIIDKYKASPTGAEGSDKE